MSKINERKTEQRAKRIADFAEKLFFFCAIGLLSCAGLNGQKVKMPNPLLTPGEVRTTDADQVCHSSTKEYRHTTAAMKRHVCLMYVEKDCPHQKIMELDHLIPLELGGADSEANLWPQPAKPFPGFHAKDKLENELHKEVCSGKISLEEAQKEIRTDWWAAYVKRWPKGK